MLSAQVATASRRDDRDETAVAVRVPVKPLCACVGLRPRMPTVRKIGAVRFFFYSDEGHEPPHVHVQKGGDFAKFWLVPVSLARSGGWKVHELRRIQDIVRRHQHEFLRAWRDHFDDD